jgi:uncharacterized protein
MTRHWTLLSPLLLVGCMSFDPYYFDPIQTNAYGFKSDVIPPSAIRQVTFMTDDGLELWGVWADQPEGTEPSVEGTPYVATFHGNSEHLALGENWVRVEYLYDMGFTVFAFDYRGYGRSEGEPSYAGILLDGQAAVAHIEEEIRAAQGEEWGIEKVPLHGLSLGGGVALHTAATTPPLAVITEDTYANPETLLEAASGGLALPAGWFFEAPFDNTRAARNVDVPILITHGAADTYIPPVNASVLFEAANEPKEKWLVPGAAHAQTPETDPDGFVEHILDHITFARTRATEQAAD